MKELTSEVKQALLAPFQSAEVRVRTYPYVAAYVTARVVMTRLDEVLPWQWSFKLIGSGVIDSNGVMHQDGALLLRHPDGAISEFHDRGSAPPDPPKSPAKQAKHAVSDCFKRCAIHAGVGRYLYELTGAQSGRIPKSALEKALAAVGYSGPWDERHYGAIGGIREADMEDEPADAAPIAGKSDPSSMVGKSEPAEANPPRRNPAPVPPSPEAPMEIPESDKRESHLIRATEEQRALIRTSLERGGGHIQTPKFIGWLAKNTANHAETLDEILSEDVEELVRKLEDLAAKRKSSG